MSCPSCPCLRQLPMLLFLGETLPSHAFSAQAAEKVWRISVSGVAKASEVERTFWLSFQRTGTHCGAPLAL